MKEKEILKYAAIASFLILLFVQIFPSLSYSDSGRIGFFVNIFIFLLSIASLLYVTRTHSSSATLKTAIVIFVLTITFWASGFLFANITVRYDRPCSPPSGNCSELVDKRVSYFAPTDRMLIDGFNDFINTHHVPRLTTLLPGTIPPLNFLFVSPWEIGKVFDVAYKRVSGDGGYASSVTRGDSMYLLVADENNAPFRFHVSKVLFAKGGSVFDYYYELFFEYIVSFFALFILRELLLLVPVVLKKFLPNKQGLTS